MILRNLVMWIGLWIEKINYLYIIIQGAKATNRKGREMSSVTEIYVCKLRQELKKGKLFTSGDIHNRQDAEQDARERCSHDDTIAKIAAITSCRMMAASKASCSMKIPTLIPTAGLPKKWLQARGMI